MAGELTSLKDGRYVLVDVVGEGGMAKVYRAYDSRLGVWRAIKVLAPEMEAHPSIRERFETEARTMALLEHPHVVRIYDVDRDGSHLFMVMELLRGGTLVDWLADHGVMPPRLAVEAILEVCAGVSYAHNHGVVHRDLKPHNVLLDAAGTCKVTDFGIARALDQDRSITRTGAIMGTHGYMAPEQNLDAKAVDGRADVYALAATLYVLLSNRVPPDLFVAFQSPEMLEPVPPPLRETVMQATEYLAEDRYQTVGQLAEALRETLPALAPTPANTPPLARPATPDPPVPSAPTSAYTTPVATPASSSGRSGLALGVALAGVALFVLLTGGALLVVASLYLRGESPGEGAPEPSAAVDAPVPSPAGDPMPAPAAPLPAPATPPSSVPLPGTAPAPAPVVPQPAPVAPQPAPIAPQPAPVVPQPAPVVVRVVTPTPAPVVVAPVPAEPAAACMTVIPPDAASVGMSAVFRVKLCETATRRVTLHYRPQGGAWTSRPVALALGQYRAAIPLDESFAAGLEYYLTYGTEQHGSAASPRWLEVR